MCSTMCSTHASAGFAGQVPVVGKGTSLKRKTWYPVQKYNIRHIMSGGTGTTLISALKIGSDFYKSRKVKECWAIQMY
jgi:hypothetical protein